jgi:hypothetical protein
MSDTRTALSDPALQQLLGFLDGERSCLDWLEENRPGVACLLRALDGGPKARQKLASLLPARWDEVFEVVACEEIERLLLADHQEVYLLFAAAKGNAESLAALRRQKRSYATLAQMIREASERMARLKSRHGSNGKVSESDAADVGCLIGEMHLGRNEFLKAVEAFTRAIENEPTADAFEGRARAYSALALQDEQRARELRGDAC